jgi:hypothetical protein
VNPPLSTDFIDVWTVVIQNGQATLQDANPKTVQISPYAEPFPAMQKDSDQLLDTGYGNLHNAAGAVDPAHGGRFVIWTEHTVRGGAGSEVRWYELDPQSGGVIQWGRVTDPNRYIFNAAITPDRAATLGTGGGDMALTFNTSSSNTYATLEMAYRRSGQSRLTVTSIKPSDGSYTANCDKGVCWWGDYSGASPDPIKAKTFWFTNMYVRFACSNPGSSWCPFPDHVYGTVNWSATVR